MTSSPTMSDPKETSLAAAAVSQETSASAINASSRNQHESPSALTAALSFLPSDSTASHDQRKGYSAERIFYYNYPAMEYHRSSQQAMNYRTTNDDDASFGQWLMADGWYEKYETALCCPVDNDAATRVVEAVAEAWDGGFYNAATKTLLTALPWKDSSSASNYADILSGIRQVLVDMRRKTAAAAAAAALDYGKEASSVVETMILAEQVQNIARMRRHDAAETQLRPTKRAKVSVAAPQEQIAASLNNHYGDANCERPLQLSTMTAPSSAAELSTTVQPAGVLIHAHDTPCFYYWDATKWNNVWNAIVSDMFKGFAEDNGCLLQYLRGFVIKFRLLNKDPTKQRAYLLTLLKDWPGTFVRLQDPEDFDPWQPQQVVEVTDFAFSSLFFKQHLRWMRRQIPTIVNSTETIDESSEIDSQDVQQSPRVTCPSSRNMEPWADTYVNQVDSIAQTTESLPLVSTTHIGAADLNSLDNAVDSTLVASTINNLVVVSARQVPDVSGRVTHSRVGNLAVTAETASFLEDAGVKTIKAAVEAPGYTSFALLEPTGTEQTRVFYFNFPNKGRPRRSNNNSSFLQWLKSSGWFGRYCWMTAGVTKRKHTKFEVDAIIAAWIGDFFDVLNHSRITAPLDPTAYEYSCVARNIKAILANLKRQLAEKDMWALATSVAKSNSGDTLNYSLAYVANTIASCKDRHTENGDATLDMLPCAPMKPSHILPRLSNMLARPVYSVDVTEIDRLEIGSEKPNGCNRELSAKTMPLVAGETEADVGASGQFPQNKRTDEILPVQKTRAQVFPSCLSVRGDKVSIPTTSDVEEPTPLASNTSHVCQDDGTVDPFGCPASLQLAVSVKESKKPCDVLPIEDCLKSARNAEFLLTHPPAVVQESQSIVACELDDHEEVLANTKNRMFYYNFPRTGGCNRSTMSNEMFLDWVKSEGFFNRYLEALRNGDGARAIIQSIVATWDGGYYDATSRKEMRLPLIRSSQIYTRVCHSILRLLGSKHSTISGGKQMAAPSPGAQGEKKHQRIASVSKRQPRLDRKQGTKHRRAPVTQSRVKGPLSTADTAQSDFLKSPVKHSDPRRTRNTPFKSGGIFTLSDERKDNEIMIGPYFQCDVPPCMGVLQGPPRPFRFHASFCIWDSVRAEQAKARGEDIDSFLPLDEPLALHEQKMEALHRCSYDVKAACDLLSTLSDEVDTI